MLINCGFIFNNANKGTLSHHPPSTVDNMQILGIEPILAAFGGCLIEIPNPSKWVGDFKLIPVIISHPQNVAPPLSLPHSAYYAISVAWGTSVPLTVTTEPREMRPSAPPAVRRLILCQSVTQNLDSSRSGRDELWVLKKCGAIIASGVTWRNTANGWHG